MTSPEDKVDVTMTSPDDEVDVTVTSPDDEVGVTITSWWKVVPGAPLKGEEEK